MLKLEINSKNFFTIMSFISMMLNMVMKEVILFQDLRELLTMILLRSNIF